MCWQSSAKGYLPYCTVSSAGSPLTCLPFRGIPYFALPTNREEKVSAVLRTEPLQAWQWRWDRGTDNYWTFSVSILYKSWLLNKIFYRMGSHTAWRLTIFIIRCLCMEASLRKEVSFPLLLVLFHPIPLFKNSPKQQRMEHTFCLRSCGPT